MILVAIPYHERKRYCLDHLFDWVDKADLKGCEVILRWHKGPFGETDAVKQQREFFRQLAVEKGASHLLFIGADTIPSLNVLPKLLAHDKDVVGAVYMGRPGADNGDPKRAVAWQHSDHDQGFLDQCSLVKVDGMGMDCVLFSRKAFTSFTWNYGVNDDDYPVYDTLRSQGYEIWLDPSLICKHYETKDLYA